MDFTKSKYVSADYKPWLHLHEMDTAEFKYCIALTNLRIADMIAKKNIKAELKE